MKPLNQFETKSEAIEYYVDNDIMAYDEAQDYVDTYWDVTRE
jgi:hypothetical protein